MVDYKTLGFISYEDYVDYFFDTILTTNHTFDYFVDWDKVFDKVYENRTQIYILNSLCKVEEENLEEEFRKILDDYPEVVPILPSILAIRFKKDSKNIEILDKELMRTNDYNFDEDFFETDDIVKFCRETGLLNLFNKIDNLYSYLVGTEVGLDTNARKNRSGTTFEEVVEKCIVENIKKANEEFEEEVFTYKTQDYVHNISRRKRADFIIYYKGVQKFVIECNFYSKTGSKPIEVASAYQELQQELSAEDYQFIWITDGAGWLKMRNTLENVSNDIDIIVNLDMFNFSFEDIIDIDELLDQHFS